MTAWDEISADAYDQLEEEVVEYLFLCQGAIATASEPPSHACDPTLILVASLPLKGR